MSAIRCPRNHCRLLMEAVVERSGHVVFVCSGCARNKRGLCRDCPRRLTDRRWMRCPSCAVARRRALDRDRDRERYPRRRLAVLADHKKRAALPSVREHRRQYMHAYRAAHPHDACGRAYNRVYMALRRADPAYRAKQNARKRELRHLAKERAA
jgi:hypothetical protein